MLNTVARNNVFELWKTNWETYALTGLSEAIEPGQMVTLEITRKDSTPEKVPVKLRIDTPIEIDYYRHGGILPFVLRELMARKV